MTEVAGHGLQAEVDASQVLTGNAKLLAAHGVEMPASVVALTGAVVYVAVNGAYAGCLRLSVAPKPDAAKAVADLARLGVTRVQLLSGDRQGNVDELARKIGISQALVTCCQRIRWLMLTLCGNRHQWLCGRWHQRCPSACLG